MRKLIYCACFGLLVFFPFPVFAHFDSPIFFVYASAVLFLYLFAPSFLVEIFTHHYYFDCSYNRSILISLLGNIVQSLVGAFFFLINILAYDNLPFEYFKTGWFLEIYPFLLLIIAFIISLFFEVLLIVYFWKLQYKLAIRSSSIGNFIAILILTGWYILETKLI